MWPPRADSALPPEQRSVTDLPPVARCLLVTGTLDAGGMDEFVAFLAQGLRAHGIRTAALLAPLDEGAPDGEIARRLRHAGIEVRDGATNQPEAVSWVRAWRPDVIAVHGNATWPIDLAGEMSVPVVLVLHGLHDLFGAPEQEVLERYRRAALVICVSELVRQQYLSMFPVIDPTRVRTIPNGIAPVTMPSGGRTAARAALGLTDEFLFLSLSRHALQKNTYGLVSAFGEVAERDPRAVLVVCGREDDLAYTRQVIALRERLACPGRVHLRGGTTRTDVLLAAADAFVLDSFFEGWALASMESLSAGVPVILSEVGGAREQLEGARPAASW
nr:glycosyltransferase [Microbacterium flavescens]